MENRTEEWLRQSNYDMDTADYMFQGGRYLYAVFMCHLAVEQALKGLYFEKLREIPPRSHSLMYLLNIVGIVPPEKPGKFITRLSEASIPTRYPEDLAMVQQEYTEGVVRDIVAGGKEAIAWILCGTRDRPRFMEDRTVQGESPRRGGGPPLSVGPAGRAEKLPHALQLRGPSPRTKRRERTSGQSFAPLSKSAVLDIVARLRRGIEARGIRPRKVILYGSYADGTYREGSDIDVVIISDDFARKGYWERIDILADATFTLRGLHTTWLQKQLTTPRNDGSSRSTA